MSQCESDFVVRNIRLSAENEKLQSELNKERIVSENLGKISDSQMDKIAEMDAQIEKLQAQVAMLVTVLTSFDGSYATDQWSETFPASEEWNSKRIAALSATEQDSVMFTQQVRDEAYEKAAKIGYEIADHRNCKHVADAIRNLKGTK